MLDFENALTNEDPLHGVDLAQVRWWLPALALVFSNFAGWPAVAYLFGTGFYVTGSAVAVAIVFSVFYHLCQTTSYCFFLNLTIWTMLDHMSAPAMMAMLVLFIINPRTTALIVEFYERRLRRLRREQLTTGARWLGDSFPELGDVRASHYSVYGAPRYDEVNELYDTWSATITYAYIFVVILATFAHPFSMQNFVIVIAFGLAAVFFKIVVIDEGNPRQIEKRVSVVDLVAGVLLIAVSLVFFVLDSYVAYWYLHTLWHVLSFVGVYFFCAGLSRNTPTFYSPAWLLYGWFRRHGCRCCGPPPAEGVDDVLDV